MSKYRKALDALRETIEDWAQQYGEDAELTDEEREHGDRQTFGQIAALFTGEAAGDEEPTGAEREQAFRLARDTLPASLRGLALDQRTTRAVVRAVHAQDARRREADAALEGGMFSMTAHAYRNR